MKGLRLVCFHILVMMLIPTISMAQQVIQIAPSRQVQVPFGMQVDQAEETLGADCEAHIIPWIEPLGSEKRITCHGIEFTFSNDLLSTLEYGKDYNFSQKIAPFPEALFNPPKSSKVMIRFGMPKTGIDFLVQSWRAKLTDAGFKEVKKEPVQDKQFSISDWRSWLKGSSQRSVVFGPGRSGMYIRYQAEWDFIIDDQTGSLTEIRATCPWFKSKQLPTFNVEFLPKSLDSVSLPVNGAVKDYSSKARVAPLVIVTSGKKVHYLVKLSDWETDDIVLTIFIRSGHTIETKVPLGSFRLKYAAGENWLGYDELFGQDTIYKKADKRFNFVQKGNSASGYKVELILQQGGNLPTDRIPKSQW